MSNLVMLLSSETKPATIRKSLVDLLTRKPVCCTSAGRREVATCSLFCTWTWAMSGSVPGAKVMVVVDWPVSSLIDDIYSRLSMPLICCSITWITVFCMVSAEAPGKVAAICTTGGETGGNCSTGSLKTAMPPTSIRISDRTMAKMGRRMKKRDMVPALFLRQRCRWSCRGRFRQYLDGSARHQFLRAADDHAFAILQAALDQPLAVQQGVCHHGAHLRLALGIGQHHGGLALRVARDGRGWNCMTFCCKPWPTSARTNMPGNSRCSGFGKRARRVTEPVAGLTVTPENSRVPLWA